MTEPVNAAQVPGHAASSQTIGRIALALSKAQAKIKPPAKDKRAKIVTKEKGSYEYAYASLDDVIAAIRGPAAENELAWTQDVASGDATIAVTTFIMHSSGEWLRFGPLVLGAAGGPQQAGSATTYARRYTLQAAFGIAAEPDDDAVAAQQAPKAGTTADTSGKATEAQMRKLHALAKDKGISHEQMRDWAGANLGIESLTELTRAGASQMHDSLDRLPDVGANDPGPIDTTYP